MKKPPEPLPKEVQNVLVDETGISHDYINKLTPALGYLSFLDAKGKETLWEADPNIRTRIFDALAEMQTYTEYWDVFIASRQLEHRADQIRQAVIANVQPTVNKMDALAHKLQRLGRQPGRNRLASEVKELIAELYFYIYQYKAETTIRRDPTTLEVFLDPETQLPVFEPTGELLVNVQRKQLGLEPLQEPGVPADDAGA